MIMQPDTPREIRQGEELDERSLQQYLESQFQQTAGLKTAQFPSGFSNLTYLIEYGENDYVLRRPPFGANVKSGHDMSREFRVLTALSEPFGKVPRPILFCDDESVIGAPFYLMERIHGIILRGKIPTDKRPSQTLMSYIANSSIETLCDLHRIDLDSHGLESLGKPDGYVSRQIEGWAKRYRKSQTDEIARMEEVSAWLNENQPSQSGSALIHNDFKYDNLILNPGNPAEVLAVLDWEMATIGDPLMDLGTTLGYWVEKGDPEVLIKLSLSPTHWPGNPTRMEVAQQYASIVDCNLDHLVFYYVQGDI